MSASVPGRDGPVAVSKANTAPSKLAQYYNRQMLYHAPLLIDICVKQPPRFALLYYVSSLSVPPFIRWLKRSVNYANGEHHDYTQDALCSVLFNPMGKLLVYSMSKMYSLFCPSLLQSVLLHPFEWQPHHYQLSYVYIASMGALSTLLYSWLYYRHTLRERLQWPYVYDYLMNSQFSAAICELLQTRPLHDNLHIDLTLKLFPIVKFNYFGAGHERQLYELKIVQFTAANAAWYCTKWSKVSVQTEQHRIVGVFLCDYDKSESEEVRKSTKREIRESIVKIEKTRLSDLNTHNKLNWCKNMCLTLQAHFDGGEWAVIVGHRAQYRSFHSVILENNQLLNNDIVVSQMDAQIVQKVPLQVNNKTNAEFLQFGMGPAWFNWSVIVAKIE